MPGFKKMIIFTMIILTLNLYLPGISNGDQSILLAKGEPTKNVPKGQIILEKDIPEAAEESWLSKYKWWLIGGLVVVAGGAAAAGGGGGGGNGGTEAPTNTGNYTVKW